MNEKLTWNVGDKADGRGSRQKAYFYWKRDGQLVRSAEFTQSELEVEIERLSEDMTIPTQQRRCWVLRLSAGLGPGERSPANRTQYCEHE